MATEKEIERLKKEYENAKEELNDAYYETSSLLIKSLYEPRYIKKAKKSKERYLVAESKYLKVKHAYEDALKER